jgi:hypothetical protein
MASSALRRGSSVQRDKTSAQWTRGSDLQGSGLGSVVSPPRLARYQRSRAARKQRPRTAESAILGRGPNRRRHRLEHVGVLTPVLLAELARLDVVVATQPRMWTEEAAYSLFMETERGRLIPGAAADLVVLAADPLATDPETWSEQLRGEMSVVGGEIVFERTQRDEARRSDFMS